MRIRLRDNVLYDTRNKLNLSRDALARRMNIASTTAYRVELDKVEPSPKFIAALIKVTGQTFEDLFEIVGEDAAA